MRVAKPKTTRPPRPYPQWRTDAFRRKEDAGYTFGRHLIEHCRDEAIAYLPPRTRREVCSTVERCVDVALHNVMDLLEGFWKLRSGPKHEIEYVLSVRVLDKSGAVVETVELSPGKVDLPVGYWKWADRDFR